MRIEQLILEAFGPFTDARVELAPDRLNVVYGPNEAGKSTTLRAIEALLFEFEDKTKDDHLHKKDKLRVGGVLTTKSGARFAFVRRKGRARTVLDPTSGEPLDDAPLAQMLGGVTRDVFRAVYGLDHARLVEGGRNLAEGRGLVGESLFSASMGVAHLHKLLASLDERAGQIYVPRGQQRELNVTLSAYEHALEQTEIGMTSAHAVERERQELERRKRALAELRERKRKAEAERAKLARVRNVRPHLIELPRIEAELARRGEPRPVDPELREKMERALDVASPAAERLEAELAVDKETRQAVLLDVQVLAYKQDIRELVENKSGHARSCAERRALEANAHALEANIAKLAGEPEVDLSSLDAAVRRAKGIEAREESVEALAAELEHEEREARAALAALGLDDDLARATRRAVPSEESIAVEEARVEPAEERAASLERAVRDAEERARELENEIAMLRASSQAPTEDELERARAQRDALVDESAKPSLVARAIAHADRLVDAMRAEAETVSKIALRARELDAAKKARARDAAALEKATKELARLREERRRAWPALGDAAETIEEARAWVRSFEDARAAAGAVLRKRRTLEESRATLNKARAELERAYGGPYEGSLADLVERLRDKHRKLERAEMARGSQLEQARRELASATDRLSKIERDATAYEARVRTLLRATSTSEGDDIMVALGKVYERYVEAERRRSRADELDARIAERERLLAQERARIAEARGALDRLLVATGATDAKELRRFEEEAREITALGDRLERARSELVRLGDGRSIAALSLEASEIAPETEDARIGELDLLVEQLSADIEVASNGVASVEQGMKRWEEPLEAAADARAEAELHVARAHELAARYVRVRLAQGVLSRSIERLRESAQGPVIQRASAIFATLTRGSFARLTVDLDDEDRPVLKGIRESSAGVRDVVAVTGMSEGTRDQLYLALRVASLDRSAQTGDPPPLVLDDALVHFDEDRARAAMGVLGELARCMQVILFTHHERTATLARESVRDVVVRRLGDRAIVAA